MDQAFKLVQPALAAATSEPKETVTPNPDWERYEGTYTWKNADMQVHVLESELTIIFPEADDPWGSRIALEPVSAHRFRAIATGASYSLNGDILTFELDESGAVTQLGNPNFYWLRK